MVETLPIYTQTITYQYPVDFTKYTEVSYGVIYKKNKIIGGNTFNDEYLWRINTTDAYTGTGNWKIKVSNLSPYLRLAYRYTTNGTDFLEIAITKNGEYEFPPIKAYTVDDIFMGFVVTDVGTIEYAQGLVIEQVPSGYTTGQKTFPPKDADLAYDEQAVVGSYTFTAGRMGAVNIQATLMYPICLDKYWTGLEYVEFRGEKYWIFSTPTSSKANDDIRYKHELKFTSERIALDNTYFFDVVSPDAEDVDQFVSNSTKFAFFGDISEFVKRMNYSLQYSGLGYSVVVDDGVSSEAKLMSFEDKFFSDVLVEVFNTYELPYYFVGKTIHIGFTSNAITHVFRYGHDKELLSISKTNANYRVINRCTGVGSSENIPYYYPNDNAKGLIKAEAGATNTGIQTSDIVVENMDLYSEKIQVEGKVEYVENKDVFVYPMIYLDYEKQYPYTERVKLTSFRPRKVGDITFPFPTQMELFEVSLSSTYFYVLLDLANDSDVNINSNYAFTHYVRYRKPGYVNTLSNYFIIFPMLGVTLNEKVALLNKETNTFEDVSGWTVPLKAGTNFLRFYIDPEYTFATNTSNLSNFDRWDSAYSMVDFSFKCEFSRNIWYYNERSIRLSDIGLSLKKEANVGDYIIQKQTTGSLTIFSDRLMPPIYRETNGEERFYPAKNDTYLSPETGEYYQFENEYQGNNPKEMIVTFDYIKPTIKNVKNAEGFPIGEILDVAFDDQDNDEFDDKENKWEHPYFYIKLRRFNGDYGFNLFDQGIANGEMTISMTSGNCSACNFKIGVSEDENVPNKFYNTVQIDDNGNLVEGDWNKKINNKNIIPAQQNTMTNEVWIAVEKDTDTFGTIMPSNVRNYKPKTGDSFVLINIDLPKAYILAAENELKEAIIKYMAANNSEKFNFSINFKRIFFAEYPEILEQLDENARLIIEYDGNQYTLYVSNYTYKVSSDQILPEITVELSDTITIKRGTLQKSIDSVKADIMTSIGSIDFLKMGLKYFIRKDVDDSADGHIVFKDGIFVTRGTGDDVSDAVILSEENNSLHEENNAIQEDTPSPIIDIPAETTLGELSNVKEIVDEPATTDVVLAKLVGTSEWTQVKMPSGGGGGGGGTVDATYTSSITNKETTTNPSFNEIEGKKLAELEGKTMSDIFDMLFFATIYPTFVAPSVTISSTWGTSGSIKNVGSAAPALETFSHVFNRGAINININGTVTKQADRAGAETTAVYTADGSETFPSTLTWGTHTYKVVVNYAEGVQPLDSKGNPYGSPLPAGSVSANFVVNVGLNWMAGIGAAMTIKGTVLQSSTTLENDFLAETSGRYIWQIPQQKTAAKIEYYDTNSSRWIDDGLSTNWLITSLTVNSRPYWRITNNNPTRRGALRLRITLTNA